ncbi:MAG: helix-turn-helix domain-containing protein [Lachnospiraceae bacterium]|nr:helix-turn-helix domain-containing protein [Lachnospiraceae bacterium]
MSIKRRYTLEELSEITAFTKRTLRNYIQKGLLRGEKERGKWYYTKEDLAEFFSSRFVRQGVKIKHQTVAGDFLHGFPRSVPTSCFLYDLPGGQEEVLQVCGKVTELLNEGKEPEDRGRFSFYYDEKREVGSFALVGDLELIGKVVELLQNI